MAVKPAIPVCIHGNQSSLQSTVAIFILQEVELQLCGSSLKEKKQFQGAIFAALATVIHSTAEQAERSTIQADLAIVLFWRLCANPLYSQDGVTVGRMVKGFSVLGQLI